MNPSRSQALVYHLGDTTQSGHYLALLGYPGVDRWSYYVCDDNKVPRVARARDLQQVDSDAYLIGVVRSP